MTKLTSRERRGTIILVTLGCGLILAMALIKGFSRRDYSEMPAIETPQAALDTTVGQKSSKLKSDTARTSRRRKSTRRPRQQAPEGRQRDFLSEPVPTR